MAKTIYLLQFNNYFNRTLKGESFYSIDNYTSAGGTIVGRITNMSLWNPNDGIDTNITSNLGLTAIPDYCVVCDGVDVLQRWFVTEAKRLQGQQYRLTLHRDVIAEENEKIMSNTESYIERGWCDVSNPAIYNSEPITFNQIKTNQRSLYDISQCPWIVLYFTPTKRIDGADTNFPEKTASWTYQGTEYKMQCTFTTAQKQSGNVTYTEGLVQSAEMPYAMAVIPYATRDYYMGDTKKGTIELKNALSCAMALSRSYSSSGWLMDMQLLPYCPCKQVLRPDGNIDMSKADGITPIVVGTSIVGALISCKDATFASTLYASTGQVFKHTVTNVKMDNLTVNCRLVSPNGNGSFEFNPAKMVYGNDAQIGFEAYCTYMPHQPYIKVVPHFGRLYGEEYGDYRGLICGGDFSLPQISDSWEAYEVQNKNYQAMFDRQIQSLELQQNLGLASDIAGAVTGTVSGVAGGALSGSMIGGAPGAIKGGIVGGVASVLGGAADVITNQVLRNDQRKAMEEQHNWQLQNIKALPYNVTKVNNFNINNTYVPYLEIYNCDDYETQNLGTYLELYSYNISRYGKFSDYVKPTGRTFIRGTFVRLNGISDDSHYLAAITDEVKQGFYIEKGEN